MDVTKLPFNEFIGLRFSDDIDYLLMLDDKSEYRNHLDTIHASAQFALAEATSGHFLLNEFSELTNVIPVVRKVEVKYKKPITGKIFSKAKFQNIEKSEAIETLNQKGRILLNVEVSLFDIERNLVMQSVFEWFIMVQK
jgi:acyl-coenzyme A thioesterase PaaI-like protein